MPNIGVCFENAKEVDMQTPDYYIEMSGELLTSKIRPFEENEDKYPLPPFFKSLEAMEDNNSKDDGSEHAFSTFKREFIQFLHFIENDWPFVRRIHEIWLSGNHEYLASQMREYLPSHIFPLNNELEYLRGIHHLFLIGFLPVLPKHFLDTITNSIWANISYISGSNPTGYIALTEFFNNNGLFDEYENRVLKILNSFISKYPFFITVIGLESYKSEPDLSCDGTTTVSFDDVKHFYLECFEAIGEIIALVVAYNNLKYRNDFMTMANSTFPTVKTLPDFIGMQNKGNKIKFCEIDETFNSIICFDTNNGLRNAIGHDSYSWDGVNQVISYYSSGKMEKGEKENIYLVEFIQKALGQFHTLIILKELLYQTRKVCYINHGLIPISSDVFDHEKKRKIGRNQPCPCGSGKKHKKCCGFND